MNTKALLFSLTLALPACNIELNVEPPDEYKPIDVIKTYFDSNNAFVYTRDLDNTTGAAAIVDLTNLDVLATGIGQGDWFSNDVVFKSDSRYIYIIDRTNANVTVVDPLDNGKELTQISVGAGTNPASVARINGKLYISRYDSAEMLVLDAETYAPLGTIDLSDYSSPSDPYPEMGHAVTAEGKVWVVLERADRNNYWSPSTQPVEGSFLISIDPETDTVSDSVKLLGTNPYQLLKVDPKTGNLYTVSSINFASGIEAVDPKSATSAGWLIETGAFPEGIFYAAATTTHVYVVSGEGFQGYEAYDWDASVLLAIDRESGEQTEISRSGAGYWGIACLELSPQGLLVTCAGPGVRVTDPGLRVFDTNTLQELTTGTLDTGLPPLGITFFARPETEVVSVPATTATE